MSNEDQSAGPTKHELEQREQRRIANCFKALFGVKGKRNETQETVMRVLEEETGYKQSVFTRYYDTQGISRIDVEQGIQRDGSRLCLIFIKNQIKAATQLDSVPVTKTNKKAKTT